MWEVPWAVLPNGSVRLWAITPILFSAPSQASENENILKKVCRKVIS